MPVPGQVWPASVSTGNDSIEHCVNWASAASGDFGSTTATDSTWSYLAAAQCSSEPRFVYGLEQSGARANRVQGETRAPRAFVGRRRGGARAPPWRWVSLDAYGKPVLSGGA